jgi:hypothetical protein
MSRHIKLILLAALLLAGCANAKPAKEDRLAYETMNGQAMLTSPDGNQTFVLMSTTAGSYWRLAFDADGKTLNYLDANTQELYRFDPTKGLPGDCLSCSLPPRTSVVAGLSDGTLAFTTETGVFVAENGQPRQVSDRPGLYLDSWFPGGDALLLWDGSDIVRLGLDGTLTNLTGSLEKQQVYGPHISPDGKWIAFHLINNDKIHLTLVSADGATVTQLADVSPVVPISSSEVTAASVDWSPDGKKLVFSILMDRTDKSNDDIYIINLDGSGLSNLTEDPAEDWQPVWSPDGKYIAFISDRTGEQDIWVMNADGSNPVDVTSSPNVWEYHPFWMP